MKQVEIIAIGDNFSAADVGSLEDLGQHIYKHPKLGIDVPGKVFLGKVLKSSGTEISFQMMPPKMEIPFSHTHNENEEIYVFLKGSGEFCVDDQCFFIGEGSVVRVSPKGKRSWKNTSDETMILMVVQSKCGSLSRFDISDGVRCE